MVGGVDIHTAIAGAMFAYLISGAMGTIVYARHGSIRWDLTASMWLGAMPAAFRGRSLGESAPCPPSSWNCASAFLTVQSPESTP